MNIWKGVLAMILAAVAAYFRQLLGPLLVLGIVMVLDYISGMSAAWVTHTLSSRVGIVGIVKKICYLLIVAVGVVIDYLIKMLAEQFSAPLENVYFFGLLVILWLIINELISILENTDEMGLPAPPFVRELLKRLKRHTEDIAGDEPPDVPHEEINDPGIE